MQQLLNMVHWARCLSLCLVWGFHMSRTIKEWEGAIDFFLPLSQALGLERRPPASKGLRALWATRPWSLLSPNSQRRVPPPLGKIELWNSRCQPAEARPLGPYLSRLCGGKAFLPPCSLVFLSLSLFPVRWGALTPCRGKKFTKEMNYAYGIHFLDE